MLRQLFILILVVTLFSCKREAGPSDIWEEAKWITYEELPDSLKIIPAVHGFGNHLGEKGLKRSVVPLFRREFELESEVAQATLNICGLGHYEAFLNGVKIGDSFLAPGWSLYQKRQLYNTFDIAGFLKKGANTLGVIVGNGFFNVTRERYRKLVVAYSYPQLIFSIEIKLTNGKTLTIVSDDLCKTSSSPITFSSIYGGEDYDARLEQPGWDQPGFNDSEWNNPVILSDTTDKLFPENDYPLKIMEEFPVQKIMRTGSGNIIHDFGQNTSGIISLKVKGNKGVQIRIRPSELVDSTGNVSQHSSGSPYEFNYILNGNGIEEWQPRFTYYGFRYAEVEITDPEFSERQTEILDLKLLHTRNSAPVTGSFECSDSLFNQIFDLILWGIKSNMASVATDCPHREKLGWLEQTYLIGPSMHYNFDIHSFYKKIVMDMMDSQLDNGLVPDIAPEYVPFKDGFRDSPEWGSAAVIIPWQLYTWYGDKEVLKTAYPMMKKYVEYLKSKTKNYILDYGLGDWYDLGPNPPGESQLTPKAVTSTSIFYYDLKLMAETANVLGYKKDGSAFQEYSEKIKETFLTNFYNKESCEVATCSQTSYAMSLFTGLIPEPDKPKVFQNLVDLIIKNDYALTSGDIGYYFLVNILNQFNRHDIVYEMNCRDDRPGYLYQIRKGATSLTESWEALPNLSNNHMMLGHLMDWFYSGLGGISQETGSVGYEKIIIAPHPAGNIKWVNCSFKSVKGEITSNWKTEGNKFVLTVKIPQRTSAKIIIPEGFDNSVPDIYEIETRKAIQPVFENGSYKLSPGIYRISVNHN
ncbi:MAG: family 78 glycoside hydrolase catalytic domain [Prolixibacteraceae bacterium]|nr:family 78 glycoside hydrolase catalytic domain [Prolixibacteraceae bacterium]